MENNKSNSFRRYGLTFIAGVFVALFSIAFIATHSNVQSELAAKKYEGLAEPMIESKDGTISVTDKEGSQVRVIIGKNGLIKKIETEF